jgi:hypothetical protein
LLASVKSRIEKQYLQYCDINIPIQKSALLLGRLLMGKFDLYIREQYLRGLSPEESAARATEDTLTLACDAIDLGIEMKSDELLNNFRWLFSTFTDYHLLTYTLWHLCARPDAHGFDRAWECVNRVFTLEETQDSLTLGSKWNVMRKLRDKAASLRQVFLTTNVAVDSVDPPAQAPTGSTLQQADQSILDIAGTAPMFADGMIWDFDSLLFPDWTAYPSGL